MQEEIRLAADVYDKLKAKANELGGVGPFAWFRDDASKEFGVDLECPICINGMAVALGMDGEVTEPDEEEGGLCVKQPWDLAGITATQNDSAVTQLINEGRFTKDAYGVKRVSWDDYVKELNIVRVDA